MSRVARILGTAGVLMTVGCGSTVDSAEAQDVPSANAGVRTAKDVPATKEPSTPSSVVADTLRPAASLKFGESYSFERDSKIDPTYPLDRGSMTVLSYESDVAPDD